MSSTSSTTTEAPVVIEALSWVHVREGRLLCVRPQGRDRLYLPGGKREPGETDEQAVAREALEEVGAVLRSGTFERVAVIDQEAHGQAPGTRVELVCYTAEYDGELAADNEITELEWIGHAERERCAPAVRDLVGLLHARGLVT